MSPRLDTSSRFAKSRKHKAGFTSVVAVAILLGLVVVMGSLALIWGNNFTIEKQKLGDYYVTNANKIKEMIVIEDVWLSTFPANTGVVVIRNVGDIAIKVSEVRMNVLNSAGGAACTLSCESGTSASNAVKAPFTPDSTDGLISSKQTLMIAVDKIDWDHADSKTFEVFITTERGSIIWRVYDWKAQLPQVITCNGLPATIIGKDTGDPLGANDNIQGTSYDDVIATRGGIDTVDGQEGNDVICGGDGGDFLEGGADNDRIFGENDVDILLGEGGDDYLDGGAGIGDTCDGGAGTNTIVNCP